MKRVLICAGSNAQAQHLAQKLGMQPTEWTYLDNPSKLMGVTGIPLLMYGTWRERENMDEFMELARTREITILYIYN